MEQSRDWVIDNLPKDPLKLHNTTLVWIEMQNLYTKYNCVSLGWGAPDFNPPKFLRDELEKAMEIPENN